MVWLWLEDEPELLFVPEELLPELLLGEVLEALPDVPRELVEVLLVVPLVPSPLEAELVVSLPLDGVPDELLVELLPMSEPFIDEDEVPPLAPPHFCCAASVFGPRMPSIGPGSHPCAFSCCCSWRTDSLPLALLPAFALAGAPWSEAARLPEDLSSVLLEGACAASDDFVDDELAPDDDDEGWLALEDCAEGWFALDDCAEGWFALDDWDWAYAVPAARSAAATATASLREVMDFLSCW